MIQRKLSKQQGYAVQALAVQLTQLQAQVTETQEGINALAELYRAHFELPEGEAQFGQNANGWSIVVTPKPKPEEAPVAEATVEG